jgi:hypothetical protein
MSKPQPDWRANIMERYSRKGHPRLGPLQVKVALPFLRLMDEAARRRGVNRSTFIRRSVAVQIAAALDRDLLLLLRLCPSAKPWGGQFELYTAEQVDEGERIEAWCPHPGCDGSHLT